ncbi:MAG TPA: hypothetical protein VN685_04790 [Rhizomicrobium sp.]|nr:hypothetical protein [Rhizomicrobium sp.]
MIETFDPKEGWRKVFGQALTQNDAMFEPGRAYFGMRGLKHCGRSIRAIEARFGIEAGDCDQIAPGPAAYLDQPRSGPKGAVRNAAFPREHGHVMCPMNHAM